jgi:probable rRNA maturation factor
MRDRPQQGGRALSSPGAEVVRVVVANRHARFRCDRGSLARAFHLLAARQGELRPRAAAPGPEITGELSLVFLSDPALARLHADYLGDPTPTDVITFAGDRALGTAGEICVSVDAALRQVDRRARGRFASSALADEITLYLVHGWLHLLGHDDLVPTRKRAMRRAEASALGFLRRNAALPRLGLRPAPPPRKKLRVTRRSWNRST